MEGLGSSGRLVGSISTYPGTYKCPWSGVMAKNPGGIFFPCTYVSCTCSYVVRYVSYMVLIGSYMFPRSYKFLYASHIVLVVSNIVICVSCIVIVCFLYVSYTTHIYMISYILSYVYMFLVCIFGMVHMLPI